MKKKILVTGLVSLHWGRIEFGNNGNYYIMMPFFKELHRVFPNADIYTTFQLSDEFRDIADINILPLSQYFSWRDNDEDLTEALKEYAVADVYSKTGVFTATTPFIETLKTTDLLISYHGDMWGDNRESTNANRFLVDLLKNATAQKMGIPTVLFASSPGPIDNMEMRKVAKDVYENFDLVVNREPISKTIFEEYGFDVSKTIHKACPAFLFSEEYYPKQVEVTSILKNEGIREDVPLVGFIVTTNSLPGGEFSDWERDDEDFIILAKLVEYAVNECGEYMVLFSHSDGFVLEPEFKRVHWRDYRMVCQLFNLLEKRGIADMSHVFKVDGIYNPWETHALIGCFDKLISGKVHGAVGGMEQYVPTMPINYQNGPKAHKMQGMYSIIGMEEYIVPRGTEDMIPYYQKISENAQQISTTLKTNINNVRKMVREEFDMLKDYIG